MSNEELFDKYIQVLKSVFFDPEVKYIHGDRICKKAVRDLQSLFQLIKGVK
jgi:predicted metal-binding protein